MSGALTAQQRDERLARYYDMDFLDVAYDAELYQELAHRSGGPVLELGVGTGRLAIPLALAGHHVVGIDADQAMLQRARRAWSEARGEIDPARLQLHGSDFSTYRSEVRFGLVLIAVNTFLLAEDDDARRAILAMMREHLRDGGVAAVEVGTPDESELARYDRRLQHEWVRRDPETGDQVTKSISAHHDPEANTLELTQIYEWTPPDGGVVSRVTHIDLLHLLSAAQLADLARDTGFESVEVRGDHLLTPYGARSHRAILVARLV